MYFSINAQSIIDTSVNEIIASDILNSLLISPSVMKLVVERITHLLLVNILRSNGVLNSAALQVLMVIFQRHGPIFSETSSKLLGAAGEGDDRQLFEEVLRSVTLVSQRFFSP